MTSQQAAEAYAKKIDSEGWDHSSVLDAFLAGHAYALQSPEVLALVEGLDFMLDGACEHTDTTPGNNRDWCSSCRLWIYQRDRESLAKAQAALAAFEKERGK